MVSPQNTQADGRRKAQTSSYVPDRGDLIWIEFDPRTGHEQAGTRPDLVVSPAAYNDAAGLALLCPITSRSKGYPFEATLPEGMSIQGVVLADQVKSLDWVARKARFIEKAPQSLVDDVLAKIGALVG